MHKQLSKLLTGLFALGICIFTVSVVTADQSVKNILPPPKKLSEHVYAWIGPLKDFDFPTRQYLTLLLTHMDKMVDEGVDAQDAIDRLDQSRFSKLANFDQLAGRNASWAYLEREAAAFE